jgi:hypothetical protein
MAKVRDGQTDPDEVEKQYQRHKKMQQAGMTKINQRKNIKKIGGGRGLGVVV